MIAPLTWWPRAFPVLAVFRIRRGLVDVAARNRQIADRITAMVPSAPPERKGEYISK